MPAMKHARILAPLFLSLAMLPLSATEPNPGWLLWSLDTEG